MEEELFQSDGEAVQLLESRGFMITTTGVIRFPIREGGKAAFKDDELAAVAYLVSDWKYRVI